MLLLGLSVLVVCGDGLPGARSGGGAAGITAGGGVRFCWIGLVVVYVERRRRRVPMLSAVTQMESAAAISAPPPCPAGGVMCSVIVFVVASIRYTGPLLVLTQTWLPSTVTSPPWPGPALWKIASGLNVVALMRTRSEFDPTQRSLRVA